MQRYKVVTITHKTATVSKLKDYLLSDSDTSDFPANRLAELKSKFKFDELMYLNTCNRVTFFFTYNKSIDHKFLKSLFEYINPDFNKELISFHISKALVFEGVDAVKHLFSVAASLDSLVLGEREILGQLKNAYLQSKKNNLCGDDIRLAYQQAIVFAKKIHCETRIGEKPVSVVSLAYRSLSERKFFDFANLLIIGAGQTNNLMANLLTKHETKNVVVYNRTIGKAIDLAARFNNAKAFSLEKLAYHKDDVDVILTCTGANFTVLSKDIFDKLVPKNRKVTIVDLAVPQDVDDDVIALKNVDYIDIASLERKAQENMQFRKSELYKAEAILEEFLKSYNDLFKERRLELAFADIPNEVKNIKHKALHVAFKKDIEKLDVNSRDILDKVMQYMEDKYIALPFKASKKSLLNKKFRP
ncbi:MAG TPA: glutamyl-tRNA reductase [Chitinophagales bacterium]|nr:glutamyl-tRNA reductase [Chitinophagales bacterium]MBP6153765.1 glutamyl-tRNA reductase [Chitinophagales bacterium]HQV77547.1 glutamyl-tRNA reductase [Chitinophagales bacterium]HQW79628.1 glutamyl-tRNA reductase [Chitinophagales bacterium]HRB68426.1 glutamyl-tRNA reductase [Chitinophagales bacterium]